MRSRERRRRAERIARARPCPKPIELESCEDIGRFVRRLAGYHKKHPDLAVVLYVRVSSGWQERKGNLAVCEWVLRRACKKLGIRIVAVFRDVISGWVLNENRGRLIAAVECARKHEAQTGRHTAVLAPCTDRFVRNADYNSETNPDATPTEAEFCKLKELTGGVPLLTYLFPDLTPREVQSYRTRWAQQFKGRKGGGDRKPGRCKRRKARLQPEACRLHDAGLSCREIRDRLRDMSPDGCGISHTTVANWLKECG